MSLYSFGVDVTAYLLFAYLLFLYVPMFLVSVRRFIKDDDTLEVADFIHNLHLKTTISGVMAQEEAFDSGFIWTLLFVVVDFLSFLVIAMVWPLALILVVGYGVLVMLRLVDRIGRKIKSVASFTHSHPDSVKQKSESV